MVILLESRDSSVGIATGYGLDRRGSILDSGKRFLFSLLHSFQTDSGAHPASYSMRMGGSFPRVKRPGVVKLTTDLHRVPTSRIVELYLCFPIHLLVLVFN
jgi:hypothetical protein